MEVRIHSNYLGMIPHHIEACHKCHFVKKIIILKNKGERVISVLQRNVNLCLERRAIAMTFRINNIKVHAGGIGRLPVLSQTNIRKTVNHKSNANLRLSILLGKTSSRGE